MGETWNEPHEYVDNEYVEQNMRRVRIEGSTVHIGEGQSAFDDGMNVHLLGPIDQSRNIGVFKTLEDKGGCELASGGYFSCAEVTGSIGYGGQFLIHALDSRHLKQHAAKILELSHNEKPGNITVRVDPERSEATSFERAIKEAFGDEVEIESKTFLDP